MVFPIGNFFIENQRKPEYIPDRELFGGMMIEDAKDLGEAVQARRRALGMTQRQLSMTTGFGLRFIVDLEAGKPTCHIGKALAVARAVGIELVDARSPASPSNDQRADDLDIPEKPR